MTGQGPKDVPTSQRAMELATAKADAMTHMAKGEHETEHGARYTTDSAYVETVLEAWPEAPKAGAQQMLKQYGAPNEATPTKLFWYRKGPWKRIMVTSDVVTHNFPTTHSDYLTQWIDYQVPIEMFDQIGRFDGSCLVDRTAGEVAARCDSEAANIITLNLMHEIVTGKRSVEDARETFAENASAYILGRAAPYAERLRFPVPQSGTHDPDESIIAAPMARQAVGKAKDILTGTEGDSSVQ